MTRRVALLAVLLMTAEVGVFAQPDPRYRAWGREALDRVRGDMDRAERNLHDLPADEFKRFNQTRAEIGEFQHRWEEGRFDKGALDHIIGNLNHVVQYEKLRPHDRDVLADDVQRLRELRERWDHPHH